MLNVNDVVKDFSLKNAYDEDVRLSSVKGKYTVIFFYPKNNTIGCTKEACSFSDLKGEFDNLDVTLVGISVDSSNSHFNFMSQYSLDLILLSDPDREISNYFGVVNNKTKSKRAKRVTFILDSNLKIIYKYDKVRPASHGEEVLEKIKSL